MAVIPNPNTLHLNLLILIHGSYDTSLYFTTIPYRNTWKLCIIHGVYTKS